MTEYATQPGLGPLTSSRHDDINDILDGYGNSFEDSESSPYGASPVPSFKELPPPPPPPRARDRKYSNDKPLPAIEKMNMPFQLRGTFSFPPYGSRLHMAWVDDVHILNSLQRRRGEILITPFFSFATIFTFLLNSPLLTRSS